MLNSQTKRTDRQLAIEALGRIIHQAGIQVDALKGFDNALARKLTDIRKQLEHRRAKLLKLEPSKLKKYEVVLDYVPDKSDFETMDNPRTKEVRFEIEAENRESALKQAKDQFGECVWSSDVY